MNVINFVNSFVKARKADGKAERTLQDYKRVLHPFTTWCEERGVNLNNLDREAIRDYVCLLRDNGWSDGTLSIYVRVLRAFLRWLFHEGRIGENLAEVIKPPDDSLREEDLLTEEELLLMLEACQGDKQAARDRTLILFLLDTGLRVSEMTLLQKEQLYPDPDGETTWMHLFNSVYPLDLTGNNFIR